MSPPSINKMASAIVSTVATNLERGRSFTFGAVDYAIFVIMLTISASIGVYFGFFSKSKNTTDEYLMGGKRMKTAPIAISLVASQLSAIAIMSVPAENYSFGFTYIFLVLSMVISLPILCYIIIPVFYENNISNCYEYLEIRFNKRTRQLVTATFILNSFLMLPVYVFVPALAFSQVTGININIINTVVCSICVFYTMIGGIKAVVWTDVLQAGIMLSSIILVSIMGVMKAGGVSKVFEHAAEGGRLDFSYSLDPRVRLTVWSSFISGVLMWTGHIGLSQSCVQRIVSLPSKQHAKKALFWAGIGIIIIMGVNSFTGIVMFARYHGCDPLKAGLVEKADKLMPFFVQDIMGHLKGMPGVFVSCVFSAALSTMSAVLNSLAGVVYFDYIKPYIKHTEARANFIMKIFIVIMGVYCVLGGYIVQHFDSIIQLIITITGVSTGALVGIFLLGMFVPRVNGKVAVIAIVSSVLGMMWIILNARLRFKEGVIKYTPLPTTIDSCEAENFHIIVKAAVANNDIANEQFLVQHTEELSVTSTWGSNREFSIYEISFFWYKIMGTLIVWLVAIPLSYIWKRDKQDKYNLHLYSPFVRRFIKHDIPQELEEMPLQTKFEPKVCEEATISILENENGVTEDGKV